MNFPAKPWLVLLCLGPPAWAQDAATRPAIQTQRWEEDWSVLADPALRTGPFDAGKYVPLTGNAYLSFGANLRERVEALDALQFGTLRQKSNAYLLDRAEIDLDLHWDGWEAFVQLEDDRALGKTRITAADADRFDVEEAFVAHTGPIGDGALKLRVGRQEFGFDRQRFVSSRDGPNVRQPFDALWADYELGDWRIISFAAHPVQTRDQAAFDDGSSHALVLDGFRVERRALGPGNLAVYYLRYERAEAQFPGASGNEQRNALDLHYNGRVGAIDFDLEAMGQQGQIGGRPVLAWAFGQRTGYTFAGTRWNPVVSLQFDAASGNTSRTRSFETFNPLFPNGSYFNLAGLTGDANLLHVKPAVSIAPDPTLQIALALGLQWRQTTRDATYTFPVQPIANTAGRGSPWSAAYAQLDATKKLNDNLALSFELARYQVGASIRQARGRNATYASVQASLAW